MAPEEIEQPLTLSPFQKTIQGIIPILSLDGAINVSPGHFHFLRPWGLDKVDNIEGISLRGNSGNYRDAVAAHSIKIGPHHDTHDIVTYFAAHLMYGRAPNLPAMPAKFDLMNCTPFELVLKDNKGVNNSCYANFHYSITDSGKLELRSASVYKGLKDLEGGFRPIGNPELDRFYNHHKLSGAIISNLGYCFSDIEQTARFMAHFRQARRPASPDGDW